MATYDLPRWFQAAAMEWSLERLVVDYPNPVTGAAPGADLLGWFWVVTVTQISRRIELAGEVEAWFAGMAGTGDRVRMHHLARPVPKGSMRGAPVLAGAAAQFSAQVQIQTTPGATLLAGDMFSVGGHLLQARFNATADAAGLLQVPLTGRTRRSLASGLSVFWDRPTAEFFVPQSRATAAYVPGRLNGGVYEFREFVS